MNYPTYSEQAGPIVKVDVWRSKESRRWEVWAYWKTGLGFKVGESRLRSVARLIGIGAAKAAFAEFQIRNRKGQISEKNTYTGNDPEETKG